MSQQDYPITLTDNNIGYPVTIGQKGSMLQITFHKALLSPREKEITIKIAQGYTIMEIAQQLFISHHTVLTHKKNIYSKTGINALPQIGVYAERMGWLVDIPLMLSPYTP